MSRSGHETLIQDLARQLSIALISHRPHSIMPGGSVQKPCCAEANALLCEVMTKLGY